MHLHYPIPPYQVRETVGRFHQGLVARSCVVIFFLSFFDSLEAKPRLTFKQWDPQLLQEPPSFTWLVPFVGLIIAA